jgi:hypothetical protein
MNDLLKRSGDVQISSQADYILVDGSASMQSKWWPSMDAIDAYVATLRSNNVRSHITVSVFTSGSLDDKQRDCPIEGWTNLSADPLRSWFTGTPLYDAIDLMGRNLKASNPPRASIVIVTDGEDNESQVSLEHARKVLDWCRVKGWQVTFIGANINSDKIAGLLGGNPESAVGVSTKLLSDAARNLGEKRARYGLYGTPMHFSDDEKEQFGGHLEDHSGSNGNGNG